MEIAIATQRILLFSDQFSAEDVKQNAWDKKTSAFDAVSKVTSFLSRPKDEDFELVYHEHRFQPFWHVIANARYIYDRSAHYQVQTKGPEVQAVTLEKTDYTVTNGHIHISVVEHCRQEEHDEVVVDGVTGKSAPELKAYLSMTPTVVTGALESHVPKGSILRATTNASFCHHA